MKTILTIILSLFLTLSANAFEIKIHNDTEHKMLYNLVWIDCEWFGIIKPFSMAKGEIQPDTINDMEVNYVPGTYGVIWEKFDKGQATKTPVSRYMIIVPSTKGVLTSTPNKLIFSSGI